MARIQIPIEALTSRLNLSGRFDSVRSQSIGSRFANLKPVSEFFDFKRLSKPQNFTEVQNRLNFNLGYFASNYGVLFLMLLVYALLQAGWLILFCLVVYFGMWGIGLLNGADLEIGTYRFTTSQLYTGLVIVAVPLFFWAHPFGILLWLVGASGLSILGHAAFMEKPIESAFSEEAV